MISWRGMKIEHQLPCASHDCPKEGGSSAETLLLTSLCGAHVSDLWPSVEEYKTQDESIWWNILVQLLLPIFGGHRHSLCNLTSAESGFLLGHAKSFGARVMCKSPGYSPCHPNYEACQFPIRLEIFRLANLGDQRSIAIPRHHSSTIRPVTLSGGYFSVFAVSWYVLLA